MDQEVCKIWNTQILKKAFDLYVEQGLVKEGLEFNLSNPLISESVMQEAESQEESESVKSNEIVVEYSNLTRQSLQDMIPFTFKLLWDGSLSPMSALYPESAQANMTTKLFVEILFGLRVDTQNDEEPQVTLLHGSETE